MAIDSQLLGKHFPFTSRFFDRQGLQLHYVDEGTGDPLVMVHGNPTWSFFFRTLLGDLRHDYRAIALDHIGCGLSDKPDDSRYQYTLASRIDDLESLLDHLLPTEQQLTLILHDWGGAIGMGYAARHPERIKRLVLLNTAAFGLPAAKAFPWPLYIFKHLYLGAWLNQTFGAFSEIAARTCSVRGLPQPIRALFTGPYDTPANRIAVTRFVQDIPLTPTDTSWNTLQTIENGLPQFRHTPALVCWGRKDFVFDRAFFLEWRRRLPHAEYHSFTNAGHYLLEDEGPAVLDLLRIFLGKH